MTERTREQIGTMPFPGMHRGRVSFWIWDMLDSWPDQWFGQRDIEAHVLERTEAEPESVQRALWRLVKRGTIEYRIGGETLTEYRIARRKP